MNGYSPSDLPALYFTYFLETEDTEYDPTVNPIIPTRDSFRVFVGDDDGEWTLVATNGDAEILEYGKRLSKIVPQLIATAGPIKPALIHGDLWSGNAASTSTPDGAIPVIFDPATYYGDREADIAMTYLFGGFGADFYKGYEDEWPTSSFFRPQVV